MKYVIIGVLGYCVEISVEDFNTLKIARTHLLEALSIEDKFNLVLENYAEFERELLNCAINKTLFTNDDWSSSIDEIHLMNRKIVNLLTTCRLYRDQVCHNIRSIYGKNSDQEKIFIEQTNQEYDSDCPGYRVIEAIRNYVQHRDLPVQGLTHKSQHIEKQSDIYVKRTVILNIDINLISEDRGFKEAILNELKSLGDSVEITPFIRQYMESLGRIHLKIRELLGSDLPKWENVIQHQIHAYQSYKGFVDGLRAVAIDSSGEVIETTTLFADVIKRRQMLEQKNQFLTHYSRTFVSNEPSNSDL